MAKNNEVVAKVRVTIGGVEASRKNLQALQTSADELSERLKQLNKQKLKFVDEKNVKGADAVVKEYNKVNAALKTTKQMIKAQEAELNNYTNILDNLANTRLNNLQKGLRDLQAQMKATLTQNDVKRYGELKAAYDQLMSAVEQLSGKVPNLTYVFKNLGGVADKTLSDSIGYMEKLIASTDKTTKRGRDNIKQWTAELKTMRDEMASRSIKVLENPKFYSVEAIQQAVASLKKLQPSLKLSSDEWDKYAQKIKFAEDYLKSYDAEQRRLMEMQKAQAAILNAPSAKTSTGTFNLTKDEAKAAAEAIEKYINTLNMSTQADEIKKATDALNIYNEALGKVKETSVDVSAILKNPKNFSTEELEKGIKQLEDAGKAIKIGDTTEIQANIDNINKLKAALAESSFNQTWIDDVVKDATASKASIQDMEKAISLIKDKMRRTTDKTVMEKLRQDLDKLNPALDKTKFNLERVEKTLGNIKGSNLGSLREAAERLKQEMADVNFNMDKFADKAAQLKAVNEEIKRLEAETKNVASAWDNAVSRLKNWVLIYAGSSEIWNQVQQSYRSVLKLSDAMSDVRKVTGLSNEEVEKLTNQIQELDTRISNEKLMAAATEAGRIGLKTREEVLQFTRASAITLTALDELDARSITSVMKLNGLLGETARLGVQQAILSTASSINELSMASSAAQQPIIDFSRRFGGIAAQANISTSQVLALGATIDALGQPIEMSSTALNKFTTALLSNGKAIAEDTGLSEEYIFDMIRQKKTIELMIEVLGKLNNMGGIGEISKYMGDMGGDGARMTAVVSALAANLGFLRQNLDLSSRSFEEGISVINEYNLKNENAAALVERISHEIRESFVNSHWVNVITTLVKGLQELVHFMLSGSVAAKAFNSMLLLIVGRIMNGTKAIKNFNLSMILFVQNMRAGGASALSFSGILKALRLGVIGLGQSIKALFLSNPFGWVLVAASWILELIAGSKELEEQTVRTKTAMERVNEAFETEAYKLRKLKDSLDAAKESGSGFSEIVSTLNRDYGKQIGYVLDLAAGYKEVAGAIDLATASKRKQILQDEKDKNFQTVQDDYREATNEQINALKDQIGIGSAEGQFEFFSAELQKELYNAIAMDLNMSAQTTGEAKLGKNVEEVLRRQAKVAAQTYYRTTQNLSEEELKNVDTSEAEAANLKFYKTRLEELTAIEKLASIYSKKVTTLKDLDEEVDRQLVAQSAVVLGLQQKQIDIIAAGNELANKAAKDYSADDEHTLNSIISIYEDMLTEMNDSMDKAKWDEVNEELKFFKARQREVMLAFIENPLRGIKMKVGEDGKLYKEVLANGKYQYESIEKLSDANLRVLVDAYKRADETFQKLMSDRNRLMDSEVRAQAEKLSKVKTAINKELGKNGLSIDDKYQLGLRNTEYRDNTEQESDKDARAAYKALLQNMEEYYGKRKEIILKRLLAEGKTIKEKNQEIKKWEVQYRQGLVDMQSELLGNGESFEENEFIRDVENYKKAAVLIRDASKTFRDQVANDMQKNRNKIIDLQFLPATSTGGADAEKGIKKAYMAILKNIEEHYAKQKQIVEQDYLNSAITVEEKNRRIEELDLQHWQARIAMQREVLGEMGENGEKIDWFNENAYIRDLENFKYVKEHMLDESHHYQDTVRADMESTVYAQEKLLSKHKRKVDEIILGNNYQAQVDKDMQEALESAGLFWGEMTDRTAKHAAEITAATREAAKGSYTTDVEGYRARLEANEVFGENVRNMTEEQFAAYLILLQQFYTKTIDADKKAADDRKKVVERQLKDLGVTDAYEAAGKVIGLREEEHDFKSSNNAYANKRKEFEMEQQLIMQRIALDDWYYQLHYDALKKAGAKEQELNELQMEHMEQRNERQAQLLNNYADRLQEMADVTDSYGSMIGDGLARMAMGEKDAGKELIKNLLLETIQMGSEFAKRIIMEQAFGSAILNIKNTQYAAQAAAAYSAAMTEVGIEAAKMTAIEAIAAGEITAQSLKQPDSILTFGSSGMARAALLIGLVSAATAAAMAVVNGLFSSSASSAKSASSRKLATGMLTYAEGRYPTLGDDGRMYNAQYEPTLRTGIYDGGKGKAHMALFSEVMPEMVVSGRTTRIIQEDFPGLMNAIMTIDKYGTLPQQRRVRRYAGGNMDDLDVEMVQNEDGSYSESPAMKELRQSNQELREAVAQLTSILANGIHANINMYGTGGIKESMDKANKFYQKNRIRNS